MGKNRRGEEIMNWITVYWMVLCAVFFALGFSTAFSAVKQILREQEQDGENFFEEKSEKEEKE